MKLHLAAWLLVCTVLSIGCGSMPGETDLGESREALTGQVNLLPVSDYDDPGFNQWFVGNPTGEKDCNNYQFPNATSGNWGCVNEPQSVGAIDGTTALWAPYNGTELWDVIMFRGLHEAIGDTMYNRITTIDSISLYIYGQSHDGLSCIMIDEFGFNYPQEMQLCWYAPTHAGVPGLVNVQSGPWAKSLLYNRQQVDMRTVGVSGAAINVGAMWFVVRYTYN